jgi:predicted phosphodiesterase
MTEVVILSDLHGNAPTLEQVVEAEGWDKQYLILGDIIGLNPYPREMWRNTYGSGSPSL